LRRRGDRQREILPPLSGPRRYASTMLLLRTTVDERSDNGLDQAKKIRLFGKQLTDSETRFEVAVLAYPEQC
jgi:hypothetical protein